MAKQTIGVGTTADDGTGDTLRAAFVKVNANTDELYSKADAADASIAKYTRAGLLASTQYVLSDVVTTTGYAAKGDRGSATYRKVSSVAVAARGWAATDGSGLYWEIQDEKLNPFQFGAKWDGVTDDTVAMNAMSDACGLYSTIALPSSKNICQLQYFTLPSSGSVTGGGPNETKLKMITGSTGMFFRGRGPRVTNAVYSGFELRGTNAAGTTGFELTAISYSRFSDIYIFNFNDGMFGDGIVDGGTNKQISNNSFINVRSNNNVRNGLRLVNTGSILNANTALTFVDVELGGNGGGGLHQEDGDACFSSGLTLQGNGAVSYLNARNSSYTLYTEEVRDRIEFGPDAYYKLYLRSSNNMWETFVLNDHYFRQEIEVMTSPSKAVKLFGNERLNIYDGSLRKDFGIRGVTTYTTAYSSLSDNFGGMVTRASFGAGNAFFGFDLTLKMTADQLAGQWVTIMLSCDLSAILEPIQMRMYANSAGANNSANGEFSTRTVNNAQLSAGLQPIVVPVKFPVGATGVAKAQIFLTYTTHTLTSTIDIESVQVLKGRHSKYLPLTAARSSGTGTTAQRPTTPAAWTEYNDVTLGYRVIYNGTNWVNGSGATV